MLATKLCALLQRAKGRELFDLAHALSVFEGLDATRAIGGLNFYLRRGGLQISRAEAEQRMFAKLSRPAFLSDVRPLLPAAEAAKLSGEATRTEFEQVFSTLVTRLPGVPWSRSDEMAGRFGIRLPG